MSQRAALAADLERDLRLTRRLLERIPGDGMDWRPHPRAFSLAGLATHLARLPHWGAQILASDGYDMSRTAPPAAARASVADVVSLFDRHCEELTLALQAASEGTLADTWTVHRHGTVTDSMTRLAALNRFVLHHLIHHRGQLTAYLRQLGVPLPPLYGPTADEPW
jgi:uncharacterized damage-inducible protein DinB